MNADDLQRLTLPSPETAWRCIRDATIEKYRERGIMLTDKGLEHLRQAYVLGYQDGYSNTIRTITSRLEKEKQDAEIKGTDRSK